MLNAWRLLIRIYSRKLQRRTHCPCNLFVCSCSLQRQGLEVVLHASSQMDQTQVRQAGSEHMVNHSPPCFCAALRIRCRRSSHGTCGEYPACSTYRTQYAFGALEPSSKLHLIPFTPAPLGQYSACTARSSPSLAPAALSICCYCVTGTNLQLSRLLSYSLMSLLQAISMSSWMSTTVACATATSTRCAPFTGSLALTCVC